MTTWLTSRALGRALKVLALGLCLAVAACGGKKELTFVGAPAGPSDGGEGNMVSATCGDRVVDDGEDCDDGARADGDGCDGSCTLEEGWTCSGEPSTCVKCGNEVVEEGEECDDGNLDGGDGCNAECKIEGSCEAPLPILLEADGDGFLGSASAATAPSEAGQVAAATCGASKAGAGADRIFEFELPGAADVDVRVGANFDAIVRVMSKACDLKTELDAGGCVDGAGVAGEEQAHFDDLAAGKYYVVVDGKTAKAAGEFTVTVEARCPLSGVKIDRVILAEPFRTVLFNSNQQCGVDLSRLGIYSQPEAADGPKTLPATTLEPLKRRVLTSESPPPAATTYQGNIRFDLEDYAGAFYLCRGECDTANGENVIDAFRWEGASGALSTPAPKSVHFDADADALTDRATMSYFRVLSDSVFPNFSKADFEGAYFVETFEDGTLSGWEAPVALFYKPKFEEVDGTLGAFSLALNGGNMAQAVWNGPTHSFEDNTGTAFAPSPSYVSLRVRGSDVKANQGLVFFGHDGKEADGFGSQLRDNGTIGFGSPPTITLSYKANTWYLIEYDEFVYPTKAQPTGSVNVKVDGKPQGSLDLTVANLSKISLRSLTPMTNFWIDQIIVR